MTRAQLEAEAEAELEREQNEAMMPTDGFLSSGSHLGLPEAGLSRGVGTVSTVSSFGAASPVIGPQTDSRGRLGSGRVMSPVTPVIHELDRQFGMARRT